MYVYILSIVNLFVAPLAESIPSTLSLSVILASNEYESIFVKEFNAIKNEKSSFEIVGSYRRGAKMSGDIVLTVDKEWRSYYKNRNMHPLEQAEKVILNTLDNIKINLEEYYYKNIDYFIDLMGLSNLLKRFPHELSGGEQQRVSIARALVREPDLLLMDEPFSNLDSAIKSKIQNEIYKILKKTNTTTILVTHDIKDTFDISDKLLVFKAGIAQQFDNPEEMYCNPANCYCAKILGELNQIQIENKEFYIRPEKIKIVKDSKYLSLIHI